MIAHERKEDRWAATLRDGTAFPLWRLRSGRVLRPSIQNIRERYFNNVPGPEYLDAQHSAAWSVPPPLRLSVSLDPHCPAVCGPFATYRRVSCLSASRATLRGGFHDRIPVHYRFGGLVNDHRQLEESKGNDYERSPCLQ